MELSLELGQKHFPKNFILHYFDSDLMKNKDPEITRYLFCMESEGKSICRIYQSENHKIELYISDLHVDEKYHKTGIGTEIMKAFENIGKELQADLYLFCNKDSWVIKWYEKLGFQFLNNKYENQIWMIKYYESSNI